VRQYGGTISLDPIESLSVGPSAPEGHDNEAAAFVASRLAELDELILEAEAEVEAMRAREQSGPLQIGCSFFGIFFAVVVVITLFMVIARRYVGSLVFYCVLAAVVIIGLARVRKKTRGRGEASELRAERATLEEGLSALQAERDRVQQLQKKLRESVDSASDGIPDRID